MPTEMHGWQDTFGRTGLNISTIQWEQRNETLQCYVTTALPMHAHTGDRRPVDKREGGFSASKQ